jgi:CubicO group peptidase (beta-lactamase class C family)
VGESLGEYMQRHIFDPLGMDSTTFWPERIPGAAERAVAYTYRKDGHALEPGPVPVPEKHEIESGGAGLFTTPRDYATFLQALLRGSLLKDDTLTEMLRPQLTDAQAAMLRAITYDMGIQQAFAPEFPKGLPLSHGIGGVVNLEDVPGKRRRGSMMWSGMCNGRWVSTSSL